MTYPIRAPRKRKPSRFANGEPNDTWNLRKKIKIKHGNPINVKFSISTYVGSYKSRVAYVVCCWSKCKASKEAEKPTKERECHSKEHRESCIQEKNIRVLNLTSNEI